MPSPLRRTLAVAVASLTLLAGLLPAAKAPAAALAWGDCPDGYDAALQCAEVTVPVDYDDPAGPTMTVAVSRLASTEPAARRGVLLVNPGGPGSAGLNQPADLRDAGLPADVLATYDVVGFDPRGVGLSTPVTCDLTEQEDASSSPPYSFTDADFASSVAMARTIAGKCANADTGTLRHLTTANTARDMDVIRTALGEPRISYLGISYGTYLGSVYAQLFPDRTDRFVLDSAVGPGLVWRETFRAWGKGAEIRFPDMARWIAARDDVYGHGSTAAEVRRNAIAFADQLERQPVNGVDGKAFRNAMFFFLRGDELFPDFAQLWRFLADGGGAAATRLLPPVDNFSAAQLAVICDDTGWPRSVEQYERDVDLDRRRYPLYGAAAAGVYACAFWQPPLDRTVEITDDGPSNILIVHNLRDPSTIYSGAVDLRQRLGDRARLVTANAGGHHAYLHGDPCVDAETRAYLLDGELPARDVYCG